MLKNNKQNMNISDIIEYIVLSTFEYKNVNIFYDRQK